MALKFNESRESRIQLNMEELISIINKHSIIHTDLNYVLNMEIEIARII